MKFSFVTVQKTPAPIEVAHASISANRALKVPRLDPPESIEYGDRRRRQVGTEYTALSPFLTRRANRVRLKPMKMRHEI